MEFVPLCMAVWAVCSAKRSCTTLGRERPLDNVNVCTLVFFCLYLAFLGYQVCVCGCVHVHM